MKLFRAVYNRSVFIPTRLKLRQCGQKVLFEAPFDVEGAACITVGNDVRSKPRLHLAAIRSHNGAAFSPELLIGNHVSINYDVHIACANRVVIGNNVLIGSKVFISDHSHGDTDEATLRIPPSERILYSKGPVVIEENVWLGEGCCILPGVRIGRNSVVGANAVVTRDVPPYSVVGGVPAVILHQRNAD